MYKALDKNNIQINGYLSTILLMVLDTGNMSQKTVY